MAINNVTSTLPDPEYIKQLEKELRELRAIAEQAQQTAIAAHRKR
jgi:hypothetical protein